jgi:hypothetical protein
VLPCSKIVTSPHRAEALRAGEEGAGQDERPLWGVRSDSEGLPGQVRLQQGSVEELGK